MFSPFNTVPLYFTEALDTRGSSIGYIFFLFYFIDNFGLIYHISLTRQSISRVSQCPVQKFLYFVLLSLGVNHGGEILLVSFCFFSNKDLSFPCYTYKYLVFHVTSVIKGSDQYV